MARSFRGEEHGRMDDKGRVLIPAAFRKVLTNGAVGDETELVLVYGDHLGNHVEGYAAAAFENIEVRIDAMQDGHPAREFLEEYVLGMSRTMVLDNTGRIVLPPKVRARCGLPASPARGESTPIYLQGRGAKFLLWHEDVHAEARGARAAETLARLPRGFNAMRLIDEPDVIDWT